MSDAWQLYDGGQQYGPFTKSEIASMMAEGRVSAAAQVWREGMAEWVPVATIVPSPPVSPPPPAPPAPPAPIRRPKKRTRRPMYVAIGVGALLLVLVIWRG